MRNKIRSKENDGEFFLSYYKDFLRYFVHIDLIHLNPLRIELNEDRQTRKFKLAEFHEEWPRGIAGATTKEQRYQDFHKNPQFKFTISNCRDRHSTCTIVISLMQDLKSRKSTKSSIGFIVYKDVPNETLDEKFVNNSSNIIGRSGAFINSRDVSKSFLLSAGSYCIIPSTFDKQEGGGFFLRLYVDSRWNCSTSVKMKTVRDYKASDRASQRCRSFCRTIFCCQCYCCCGCSCLC